MPKTNPFVKNAFIIRPFGKKPVSLPGSNGKKESTTEIDFDRVEAQLIGPALTALGIRGRTTIEIIRAGNIREDMFHRLLTADLVIADLSIHNANVFYELGLRHAFRDKHTFLLRCEGFSNYPFDLQTDRYYTYKLRNPAASLPGLVAALSETISSDREDSPVYRLLPNLKTQDRSRFLAAPREFCEAIQRAKKAGRPGDLRLLAVEAEDFIWEIEGLREVGRAQNELNFHWGARATWETLRRHYPDDHEANLMLTRIYQRLYEHSEESELQAKSEQALERIYKQPGLERVRQSEVLSLIGRQRKAEWIHSWEHLPDEQQRREQALNSLGLQEAFEAYNEAFYENLNNYNAGINALSLLMVQNELARAHRNVWDNLCETPEKELDRLARQITKLKSGVELSLEAEKTRNARDRNGKRDYWLELNEAGFYCITSTQRVRVRQEFDEALRLAPPARIESLHEVLNTYRLLGVFTENVEIAFKSLATVLNRQRLNVPKPGKQKKRILLFAGHRLDPLTPTEALRQMAKRQPRFPRDKEYEEKARQAIEEVVKKETRQAEILFGMSGGANGGEIIFHETCHGLQLNTQLYLAVPREEFIGHFVSLSAEPDEWYERFNRIYLSEQTVERVQLSDSLELPRWLQLKPHYDIRRRSGLWMLQNALVNRVLHDADVTLIALWDGKEDDASGTIDDLIKRAYDKGIKVVLLETREIFGR